MRFTSPFVGIAFPTYQTCALPVSRRVCEKYDGLLGLALEQNDDISKREWLTYWAVYGCFTGLAFYVSSVSCSFENQSR
jgi:hypothetical protein